MSKRGPAISTVLVAVMLAVMLAGCAGDAVTGAPSELGSVRSSSNRVSIGRAFEGDCDLTSQGLVFSSPTSATQVVTGTCNLAHLGRSTVVIHEAIDFTSMSYSSIAVFTAANGDKLRTGIRGIATPTATGLSLAGNMLMLGGTGRFATAWGWAAQSGFVPYDPSVLATYHLEGRLIY